MNGWLGILTNKLSSKKLQNYQRSCLYQSILSLYIPQQNYEAQKQCLLQISNEFLGKWKLQETTNTLNDEKKMLEICQLLTNNNKFNKLQVVPIKQFFFPIKFLIAIGNKSSIPNKLDQINTGGFGAVVLNNISFSTQNPFNELFPLFCNNLFLSFKFFNLFWSEPVSKPLFSFYPSFFNIDPSYYNYLVNDSQPIAYDSPHLILPYTLNQIHENLYFYFLFFIFFFI